MNMSADACSCNAYFHSYNMRSHLLENFWSVKYSTHLPIRSDEQTTNHNGCNNNNENDIENVEMWIQLI